MTFKYRVVAGALALLIIGTTAAEAASASAVNRQFRAAVARVLASVRNETDYLRGLSSSEFRAFVSCAQGIMDGAPLPRKQYVLSAPNLHSQRQRFDEVALDNRAALKQKIARECA
jgi:hypothetical protein